MNFLDAAFYLVPFGWKVFPLLPRKKIPAIAKAAGGNGCLDATDDEEIIADWHYHLPGANIGIATGVPSGIIVIDLDPRNGSDESIAKLKAKRQEFPATVTAKTGNGGTHLYYSLEPELKNSKSVLAPGIDVKTTGGYIVAPPSVLDGGKRYEWINSPLGGSLPRLPRWAVEALKPKPLPVFKKMETGAPAGSVAHLANFVTASSNGERNKRLFWAALRAAEAGFGDSEKAMLLSAALAIGLSKIESEKTIESAFKKVKL